MYYNHNEIESRNTPENLTQFEEPDYPLGDASLTTELIIEDKIKLLEAEYNKLPYMRPDFSIEKERENSEKRIELFYEIKSLKTILNGTEN